MAQSSSRTLTPDELEEFKRQGQYHQVFARVPARLKKEKAILCECGAPADVVSSSGTMVILEDQTLLGLKYDNFTGECVGCLLSESACGAPTVETRFSDLERSSSFPYRRKGLFTRNLGLVPALERTA